jgi:hypothetical protein
MLDAYVIEEIKRRDSHRGRDERPSIQIPVPDPQAPEPPPAERERERPERGVIIIDLD